MALSRLLIYDDTLSE